MNNDLVLNNEGEKTLISSHYSKQNLNIYLMNIYYFLFNE